METSENHFRDSKFKTFPGPSALAFSPPPPIEKSFLRPWVISDIQIICTLQLEKPPLEQDLIDKYGNMLKEKQQHAPQKRRIINNSSSFITMV
jgi:hypothetical protein